MSGVVVEFLNRGLVNARDRSLLRPGELARCNNGYYKPHDDALHKHPGRTRYNATPLDTTPASDTIIKGLRYLEFDNVGAKLIAYRHDGTVGKISKSDFIAETGTFTEYSQDVGQGPTMDAVHIRDKYVLLIGIETATGDLLGKNLVVRADSVARRNGLAPVVSPPTAVTETPGAWPGTDEIPLGWYFFITTETHEELEFAPDFLESAWEGTTMAAVNVTATNQSVRVTFPPLVNTGNLSSGPEIIDARRVYMAGPIGDIGPPAQTDRPPDPALSAFRLVGQAPVSQLSTLIGGTALSGSGNLPGTASQSGSGNSWNDPNKAKLDDNDGAIVVFGGASKTLFLTNFVLAVPAGVPITGIEVEVKAMRGGNAGPDTEISVGITKNGTTNVAVIKTMDNFSLGSFESRKLGGSNQLWGIAGGVTEAEAEAATFGVMITADTVGNISSYVSIDHVRVKIYTPGTASDFPFGQAYPYVAIPIGDSNVVLYSANSEPPVGSTGDIFNGMMVMNDVNEPGEYAWSLPNRFEYFPSPYRGRINRRKREKITCIRALNEILLVGTERELHRINRIPRAEDSLFDTNRIRDTICSDKGVVNVHAITTFSTPGQPELAAFVSHNGLHFTDGFRVHTLIEDIDWEGMVNVSELDTCTLVNYSKYHLLVFSYIPAGDVTSVHPTKRLILHYHPSHVRESGKLMVTGPIDLNGASADIGWLNSKPIHLTGATDGRIYVEDRNWLDTFGSSNLILDIVTRDIYPVGVGYEATLERTWWRHYRFNTPVITLTITPWYKKTGGEYITPAAGARWTISSKARDASAGDVLPGDLATVNNAGALERIDTHFLCESFVMQLTTDAIENGYAVSYMAYEVEGRKLSDNPG